MFRKLTLSLVIAGAAVLPVNLRAQSGCTDPMASNYNSSATQNDGSCVYPSASVSPFSKGQLSDTVKESSGLVYWDGMLWTHNDDGDAHLYALDTLNGKILRRVLIAGVVNNDWEEITQDSNYFYIGDFGNNGNGNRTDLSVLKVAKADLAGFGPVTAQRIRFSYADQTDFSGTGNNNTDFDCEAFVAAGDSLYLFTKQWVSKKSKIYVLPKIPGTYSILSRAEFNTDGMITGATHLPGKRIVVLSGYKIAGLSLLPFVYLLYDYPGLECFAGNKRRIEIPSGFLQVEGIATEDGSRIFITNERFSNIITIPASLQAIDLSPYVTRWYQSLSISKSGKDEIPAFYPNPGNDYLYTTINAKKPGILNMSVYDSGGLHLKDYTYNLNPGKNRIELIPDQTWGTGQYFFELAWEEQTFRSRVELRK